MDPIISKTDRILITGSSGFIGRRVVDQLLERGFENLRCFVRPSSQTNGLRQIINGHPHGRKVEIVAGDLLSREDCARAAKEVAVVYHLAAGIEKSFAGAFMNSALATRNLIEAFLESGCPRRFVNVSSFAVYSNFKLGRGSVLDETCPLERDYQSRNDAYGFGKAKQEEIVREYGENRGLSWVMLRPGAVFGPGKPAVSGRVGIDTFGFFLHMGGSKRLPLTYVDNCAEAIVLAGLAPGVEGEVFNIVDDDPPKSRAFLRACKKAKGGFFSLPIPYPVAYAMCHAWEKYSRWSQGQLPPVFNRQRCSAEWKGNRYSNEKLRTRLGWKPRVPMAEAMERFLAQFSVQESGDRGQESGVRDQEAGGRGQGTGDR